MTSGKVATTIGYERRFNPSLRIDDEAAFVEHMLRDQPVRPANMVRIVAINQGKSPYTSAEPEVVAITPAEASEKLRAGSIALDVRPGDAFGAGHVPGSIAVPVAHGSFEQWAGWVLPQEGDVILAVDDAASAQAAVRKLAFVGLDRRARSFVPVAAWRDAGLPWGRLSEIECAALDERLRAGGPRVLDVRDASEWDSGHIVSAVHRSFKQLGSDLEALGLARDEEVAVTCAGGLRSVIACSLLERAGFSRIVNVRGGMGAWRRAGLPVSTS